MATDPIHSRTYQNLRATLKAAWRAINTPCALCGQDDIDWDAPSNDPNAFELDHKISRKRCKQMGRPDLILDPANCQPSHHRCNRCKGERAQRPSLGENTEEW